MAHHQNGRCGRDGSAAHLRRERDRQTDVQAHRLHGRSTDHRRPAGGRDRTGAGAGDAHHADRRGRDAGETRAHHADGRGHDAGETRAHHADRRGRDVGETRAHHADGRGSRRGRGRAEEATTGSA